jgi:hypothetical protein
VFVVPENNCTPTVAPLVGYAVVMVITVVPVIIVFGLPFLRPMTL